MFKNIKYYSLRSLSFAPIAALGFTAFIFAANADAATAPTNLLTSTTQVSNLFCTALDWLFWFLIVLSIAMALVAAYMYLTSNGDSEQVGKATKTLTFVAIAIVVALIAKGVPSIVSNFLGNGSLNVC